MAYKLDQIQTYMQETLWWILNIVANNNMASAEAMRDIGIDVPDNWTEEMLISIAREEALRGKKSEAQLRDALFKKVPIIHDELHEELYASIAVLNHEAQKMQPLMLQTNPTNGGTGGNGGNQQSGGIDVNDISMWGDLASAVIGTIGGVLGAHQNGGQNGNQPVPQTQPANMPQDDDEEEILGISKTTVMWGSVIVAIVFIGGMVALYFNAKEERELKKQLNA